MGIRAACVCSGVLALVFLVSGEVRAQPDGAMWGCRWESTNDGRSWSSSIETAANQEYQEAESDSAFDSVSNLRKVGDTAYRFDAEISGTMYEQSIACVRDCKGGVDPVDGACPDSCTPSEQPKEVPHKYKSYSAWETIQDSGSFCAGGKEWVQSSQADIPAIWLGSQSSGGGTIWYDKTCNDCTAGGEPVPEQGKRLGGQSPAQSCATGPNGQEVCADKPQQDDSCPGGAGTVDGQYVCLDSPGQGSCQSGPNGAKSCAPDAEAPLDADGNPKEPDAWVGAEDGSVDSSDGDGDGEPGDGLRDVLGFYGPTTVGGPQDGSGDGSGEGGEGDGDMPTGCDLLPVACDTYDWLTQDPANVDKPEEPEADWAVETIDESDLGTYQDQLPAAECPSDTITVFDQEVDVPWQPMCDFAQQLNPLVQAAAWLVAIFIVVRAGR